MENVLNYINSKGFKQTFEEDEFVRFENESLNLAIHLEERENLYSLMFIDFSEDDLEIVGDYCCVNENEIMNDLKKHI